MKYQIIDHGVEHSQYFQGCGVAFTDYDNVVTGIGNSYKEALEDAIESMSQETSIPDELEAEASNADDEETTLTEESGDEEYSELYHHVSIRWTDSEEESE